MAYSPPQGSLRSRREGFLLIEALATLAISAVILAGLTSLLGLMSRQADRLAERAQDLEVTGRALAAMGRDIERAIPMRWAGRGTRPFVFSGQPDWIVLAMDRLDEAGLIETVAVRLESVGVEAENRVERSEARLSPFVSEPSGLTYRREEAVYAGHVRMRFAYVAGQTRDAPETVVDAWSGERMPVAVRVSLTDPRTGDIFSSLRIPLRINGESGCAAPRKAFCSRIDERALAEAAEEPAQGGTANPTVPAGQIR